ncbi:MAG TPA: putative oxidoreductase C-terminal domain-containing protein [Steroidobacteraceae bacterium]|nr:putative oxidoreductase C-terminal domain-containing protein [Steroidobacteraceae bacterium]
MKTMTKVFACLWLATGVSAAEDAKVQIITLDPGHFHAALVQKFMLPGVSPVVRVYAPEGDDVGQHLKRVEGFNKRADHPTQWQEVVYTAPDYLQKALTVDTRPVVVVISGNNARKSEYITRSIDAGFNVLADKPMVIRPAELPALEAAFKAAKQKRVLLYDIMTERYEITTILQRELSMQKPLFGTLERGAPDSPSISKISVHNFSKVVAGAQLKRPQWFFDPEQQGAGIVDVTTHLVDLVQWEAFPNVTLAPADAKVLSARRWPTKLTLEQFGRLTGATAFPDYLARYVTGGVLMAPSNGEFTYTLKGVHAKVSVTWDFEAPPGAGDTHFSEMRGTKASLTIRQGKDQNYKPVLYVDRATSVSAADHEKALRAAVAEVAKAHPGIEVRAEDGHFVVTVPEKYHVGHEAHFTQVTENFLQYLRAGKLPDWEVPNMMTKYATIMQAYELSR